MRIGHQHVVVARTLNGASIRQLSLVTDIGYSRVQRVLAGASVASQQELLSLLRAAGVPGPPLAAQQTPYPWINAQPALGPVCSIDRLTLLVAPAELGRALRTVRAVGRELYSKPGSPYRQTHRVLDAVTVQWGHRFDRHDKRVRVDFNPSSPMGAWVFKAYLAPLFSDEEHRVSRIDFAIDYPIPMDLYQLAPAGRRRLHAGYHVHPDDLGDAAAESPALSAVIDPSEHVVSSLDLGRRPRRLVQYDKRRQTGMKCGPWTRVEAQLRPALRLSELPAMRDPFGHVLWLPLSRLYSNASETALLVQARRDGFDNVRQTTGKAAYLELCDSLQRRQHAEPWPHPSLMFDAGWRHQLQALHQALALVRRPAAGGAEPRPPPSLAPS